MKRKAQSGLLLIVMVGILTLLFTTAVFFVALMKFEKGRTVAGSDKVRAKLLSRSGLEYSIARLLEHSAIPESIRTISPEDDWRFRDEPHVSLEKSFNPSFNADPYLDGNGNGRFDPDSSLDTYSDPDQNEQYDGWSGRLRGVFDAYSDRFKLQIENPSGKISVNGNGSGPFPDPFKDLNENGRWDPAEPFTDLNGNGRRDPEEPFTDVDGNGHWSDEEPYIDRYETGRWDSGKQKGLDHLLKALGGVIGVEELSEKIASARPIRNRTRLAELLGKESYEKASPFLTLWGRPDETTFQPVSSREPVGKVIRFQAALNRIGIPVSEPRVPVAVNAASKEVLEAVFRPLRARFIRRFCDNRISWEYHPAVHTIGTIKGVAMINSIASTLADVMSRWREEVGPFRTWRQWESFVNGFVELEMSTGDGSLETLSSYLFYDELRQETFRQIVETAGRFLSPERASLVSANCYPNARLNKFNPDSVRDVLIDKSDLVDYTTEFTLGVSGRFEVESLGEVMTDRAASANDHAAMLLSMWKQWRQTTQRDFSAGTSSANDDVAFAPSFRGRGVQTYPEPEVSHLAGSTLDGYLTLATNRSKGIGPAEAAVENLLFYASYEEGLDSEFAGGSKRCYAETENDPEEGQSWTGTPWHPGWDRPEPEWAGDVIPGKNHWQLPSKWDQAEWAQASGRPNENSVTHGENPGSLYPDGVFSDWRNVPAYSFENNFESEAGVVSFWAKYGGRKKYEGAEAYKSEHVLWSATYFPITDEWHPQWSWTGYENWHKQRYGDRFSHRFSIAWKVLNTGSAAGRQLVGMIFEPTGTEASENTPQLYERIEEGKWMHFGGAWDETRTLHYEASAFGLNGVSADVNMYAYGKREVTNFDFSGDDTVNRKRFRLGEISRPIDHYNRMNWPACSTIDELCIYGRQGPDVVVDSSLQGTSVPGKRVGATEHVIGARLIWERHYLHGRYYNLGNASFTSEPRKFPETTRFLIMRWTTWIPKDPAANFRILLDFFDGRTWLLDLDNDGQLSAGEEEAARARGLTDESGMPVGKNAVSETRGIMQESAAEMGLATPSDGLVRWRAYFKEDADWLTTPLLESPVLDDVTLLYVPAGGPVVVSYEEE